MNLEVRVFDTKLMKRLFYSFVSYNILAALISSWLHFIRISYVPGKSFMIENSKVIFTVLLVITFAFTMDLRRRIKKIRQLSEMENQFRVYEQYYRRRLIWNCFSVSLSGLFLVLTHRDWFFYLLLLEVVMSFSAYPSKQLIQTELKDREILVS